VNTRLNKNQAKLGILVLSVSLQMLSDLNGLLDEHVKILWDIRGQAVGLEDSNNFLSSDGTDGGDTVGVTKQDTNLRRGQTLLGELADMVLDVLSGELEPSRRCALVRHGTLRDTLSWSMHATHDECFC